MDRFFDNYIMTTMQKPVFAALRSDGARKEEALAEARQALDTAYAWLEKRIDGLTWATGENFTMADCAAAPSLFYIDWVHQTGPEYPVLDGSRHRPSCRLSVTGTQRLGSPRHKSANLGCG